MGILKKAVQAAANKAAEKREENKNIKEQNRQALRDAGGPTPGQVASSKHLPKGHPAKISRSDKRRNNI